MQPFFDIASAAAIYLFCRFLFMDSTYNESIPMLWYVCTILTVAPIILALSLGGSYGRNWMHGSTPDYIHFIECLASAFLLLILLDLLIGINGWRDYVAEHLLFFAMTTLALLGGRLFLRYLKHHLINEFYIGKRYGINLQKILLCGAGADCRYYIANQGRIMEENPSKIIGIIEENPEFQGHHVFGLELLGSPGDIEKIYDKTKFDKITFTRTMSMSAKQLIADFCKEKNIPLTEWKGKESTVLGMSGISI
jgi:FlaA1/EpsC-like NDP-sugar epimerase